MMILSRVLFYKLTEIAIDAFFDGLFKNFNKGIILEKGVKIDIKDLKRGDRFSAVKIPFSDGIDDIYNKLEVIYHDVIIESTPKTTDGRIGISYLYREMGLTDSDSHGSSTFGGIFNMIPDDVLKRVTKILDKISDDDDIDINEGEFCLYGYQFSKVFDDIRSYIMRDLASLKYSDMVWYK